VAQLNWRGKKRHVKPLVPAVEPTNPHWALVVGYGPFSLLVIHKEGLCPGSGDINRLMMIVFCVEELNSPAVSALGVRS
jgi:hypothetical protein